MPLLGGKVVLVSGGTQGVGAGVARAAVRAGAAVALLGRNPERGEAVVAELAAVGAAATFVRTDVADPAEGWRRWTRCWPRTGGWTVWSTRRD